MKQRTSNRRGRTITSHCNGLIIRGGSCSEVARTYEKFAYDAQRAENIELAEVYFQHAEHYKREGKRND